LNNKGLTVYESTKSNDIRHLFRCPSTSNDHRFCDQNVTESLTPVSNTTNQSSVSIPDDWLRGHTNAENAIDGQFMVALSQAPRPLRKLIKMSTRRKAQESFELLIQKCIEKDPSTREKIMGKYEEYKSEKKIDSLLAICSMATPIYRERQTRTNADVTLLFLHLDELTDRVYPGETDLREKYPPETYCGVSMTQNDIEAYKWAEHNKEYVLETRTFQSTSKSKAVVEMFSEVDPGSDKTPVILTFIFKEKCSTAIDLNKLAHFAGEEEVLLFPFTSFRIDNINDHSTNKFCHISLIYVPPKRKSLISSWFSLKD
jgi:hypothetical protein